MNNPQSLSLLALWGAAILYAIAMVAYSIRLAREADFRVQQRLAEKRLVAAPAVATGSQVGATAVATRASGEKDLPISARKALGIAKAATLVGAVLHGLGIIARGIEAGHVPWSNMYEYTITGSLLPW